jgi:hypothetical protein
MNMSMICEGELSLIVLLVPQIIHSVATSSVFPIAK